MFTPSEIECERYVSWHKRRFDRNTIMYAARLAQGEKIGAIHVFEEVLNRPQTPREQLIALSLEDLSRLADELRQQLPKQA